MKDLFLENIEGRLLCKVRGGMLSLEVCKVPEKDIVENNLSGYSKMVFDYCASKGWNPKVKLDDDPRILIYWSKEE